MSANSDSLFPKPTDWGAFENMVCSAAENRWKGLDFTLNGRSGQKQNGVDIYGYDHDGKLIGLQCKNTPNGIGDDVILSEIKKAEEFNPPLSKLYVATTADRDVRLQEKIRLLTADRMARGVFQVHMLFWQDVCRDLALDESRLYLHFPQFRPKESSERTYRPGLIHDRNLFQKFKDEFSSTNVMELINDHDFRGGFALAAIKPLFSFVDNWNRTELEFLDEDLQTRFGAFQLAASSFSAEICERTVPIGTEQKTLSVRGDQMPNNEISRRAAQEDGRALNKLARIFSLQYSEFYRACRARLER